MSMADLETLRQEALDLLQGGPPEDALVRCERLRALCPDDLDVLLMLGTAYGKLRRFPEAEDCFRQVTLLEPRSAQAHRNLAKALMEQQRHAEAIVSLEKAVALRPDDGEICYALGCLHGASNDLEAAEAYFRKAVALDPDNLAVRIDLGNLLGDIGRYDEALEQLRTVADLNPEMAMAYFYLGVVYHNKQELHMALRQFQKALELDPQLYSAMTHLGDIVQILGELDWALFWYQKALDLRPDYYHAVAGKAQIHVLRSEFEEAYNLLHPLVRQGIKHMNVTLTFASVCEHFDRIDEAVGMLEDMLRPENAASLDFFHSTLVHFRLGRLYDKKKEFARAFSHFSMAHEGKSGLFVPSEFEHSISDYIRSFGAERLRSAPRCHPSSVNPIFIVGMPRSGTSLAEQMLASHPLVHGLGESRALAIIAKEMGTRYGAPYPEGIANVTQAACDAMQERYLALAGRLPPGKPCFTDKMPHNFIFLGLIELLFPNARIVHCVRNPLDTCLSCYFQAFAEAHPYVHDLRHLGLYYRQYERLMAHWNEVLSVPIFKLSYEELVHQPEETLRRLLEHCGLPWDEHCMLYRQRKNAMVTASNQQVRRAVYKSSIDRWKHYEAFIEPLRHALEATGPEPG